MLGGKAMVSMLLGRAGEGTDGSGIVGVVSSFGSASLSGTGMASTLGGAGSGVFSSLTFD